MVDKPDPDPLDSWPRCPACGRIMELVDLEPHLKDISATKHTFRCSICGETVTLPKQQSQGAPAC